MFASTARHAALNKISPSAVRYLLQVFAPFLRLDRFFSFYAPCMKKGEFWPVTQALGPKKSKYLKSIAPRHRLQPQALLHLLHAALRFAGRYCKCCLIAGFPQAFNWGYLGIFLT